MKTKLVCVSLFVLLNVGAFGQTIDFENFDLSDIQKIPNNDIEVTNEFNDNIKTGKTLKFISDGGYFVLRNQEDVKRIRLKYTSLFTGDATLIGQINSGTTEGKFTELRFGRVTNFIKDALKTNTLVPSIIPVQVYGKYDLKIQIQFTSGSGVFVIDDLIIENFTPEEKARNIADNKAKHDEALLTNTVFNRSAAQAYNQRVDIIKRNYGQNIEVVRDLKIKTSVLAAISKTFVLVDQRNLMSDPSSYTIFTDKIALLKTKLDPLQAVYLDSLVSDIKQKPIFLKDPEKREGLKKFALIAGDVANLITGGQFKGVVNSIQGLLSSVFNINNLKVKIPEVVHQTQSNGRIILVKNPEVADANQEINKIVKEGTELQKFFFEFFGKLKGDRERFVQIVDGFASYASEADLLIDEINQVEAKFFTIAKIKMDETTYKKYLGIGGANVTNLKGISDTYFENFKVNITDANATKPIITKDDELNFTQSALTEISTTKNQYDVLATKLSNLFSLVEADLKRENPFGKKDADGKIIADGTFGDSFQKFENMRKTANTTLASLKPDLKIILANNGN